MKSLDLRGKKRKNDKYHSYKGEVGKVADNLLNRDFTLSTSYIPTFITTTTREYLSN